MPNQVEHDVQQRVFTLTLETFKNNQPLTRLSRAVYYESFGRIEDAIAREKQLKKWNREWKDKLITEFNPEWKDLFVTL